MPELPNEDLLIEKFAIERIKPYARNPRNSYCSAVIAPKVAKFRKKFLGKLAKA